jgi:hypothetical protein
MQQELGYAARIAPDIRIVRVVKDRAEAEAFCALWDAYLQSTVPTLRAHVRTEALISPYRTTVLPLANFLTWQQREMFPGKRVAVLLPREVKPAWWEWPLQRRIADEVRMALIHQASPLQLIDLPYTLGVQRGR